MLLTSITILVSTVLAYITSLFANDKGRKVSSALTVLVGASILSGIIIVGCKYVSSWWDEENELVGRWIEQFQTEEGEWHFAIAEIEYNWMTKEITFSGSAYDGAKPEPYGGWISKNANLESGDLLYFFEGYSFNKKDDTERKGVGEITMYRNLSGTGKYISYTDDQLPRDLIIEKILDEDYLNQIESDEKEFVRALYSGTIELRAIPNLDITEIGMSRDTTAQAE
ncbi:MAG: hypothetical protein AAF433_17855 [Bacteroidota bacterium]